MGISKRERLATCKKLFRVACLLAVSARPAVAVLAQAELPPPVLTTNAKLCASMEALDDTQPLGPGDRVSYRVIEDKDQTRSLVVTDSGELDVPYLGRVGG